MKIELTEEEALVLSGWLSKNSQNEELFDAPAEQYVLWSMEAQMEKALDEPHMPDYTQLIAQARKTVRKND